MAFTLQPVGPADVSDITRIFQSAFANDHIMSHFHPRTPDRLKWDQDFQFFSTQIAESAAYGGRLTKVVEESSGKTVAFSKWDYPHALTAEQRAEKKRKAMEDRLKKVVEGSNEGLMKDFFTQLIAGRERWLVPEKTFFLHILAVDPAYQRRGLGSMLIRPGLEDADKAGAQTYIEASPDGLPLYLKHGWEPVDKMVIDMGTHEAGSGVEVMPFLMREANAPNKVGKKIDL
ncbi:hypothetical protein HO133_009893 [Letharia lupina]|uniref:N-acetyltransferase domain-containing protein n=1 Tax=Letharia lupina TaxID=560253 RepID=A0A8H6FF70_9LECA|nr:uncharacterized protein HO133_009893 [Letharia lupina]KAF6225891.1 hypothetical protein HO133_009893 [Letharia lupina]